MLQYLIFNNNLKNIIRLYKMLITLYENTNPTSFNQDFAENVILPRNAELKLLSAFCNRKPIFELDASDNFVLKANDKDWAGEQVVFSNLSQSGSELAATIKLYLQKVSTDKYLDLKPEVTYDATKNAGIGAFTFDIKALSLYYNQDNIILYNNAASIVNPTLPYANWAAPVTEKNANINTYTINRRNDALTPLTSNFLGCSEILDASSNPIFDFRNVTYADKEHIERNWYNANIDNAIRPVSETPFGMFKFNIKNLQNDGLTYWVGITAQKPDITAMTTGGIDSLDELKDCDYIALFMGSNQTFTPVGSLSAGDIVVGAYSSGWSWNKLSATATQNDRFAFVLPTTTDEKISLHKYDNALADGWRNIHTYNFDTLSDTKSYSYAVGFQQQAVSGLNANQQLENIEMTSKQSYNYMNDMGQYIELQFSSSLALKMGLSHSPYKNDTIGTTDKAHLHFQNDKKGQTKLNVNEPPFVCLDINNLPVKSYTSSNSETGVGYNGLQSSKTIANLSRFDYEGNYNGHLMDVGNNQPVIRLKNAEEITLSQLHIRLKNVDGTIPNDLSPPFCANIEITEAK
jgi:hypothetical protein